VAGRNLIFHDKDHPSQLLLGTRLPGPPAALFGPTQQAATACRSSRRLRVRVASVRARRVVRVAVYYKGRRLLLKKGRNLTSVTIARPPAKRFVVKMIATDNRGKSRITRRRLRACAPR
jgi:hypothetical protein